MIVLGDVHGKYRKYLEIIDKYKESVCLGDFGFDYKILNNISKKHRIIAGNHDNHDEKDKYPHFLGKFGKNKTGDVSFFFVSGAFSIDWKQRLKYEQWPTCGEKSWWADEELTQQELEKAVNEYDKCKPKIVLTHEAPRSVAKLIGNPCFLRNFGYDPNKFTTRTSEALEVMFKIWQPKLWIFGHFHRSWTKVINNTKFRCLNELEFIDIDKDGKIK